MKLKYIKLFEELKIEQRDFPNDGYDLSPRESQILHDIFGKDFFDDYTIKKDDGYYYLEDHDGSTSEYERFEIYDDLIGYLFITFLIQNCYRKIDKISKILEHPKIDPSVNGNSAIKIAIALGDIELVKLLLEDPRVDKNSNDVIEFANKKGNEEIIKLINNY